MRKETISIVSAGVQTHATTYIWNVSHPQYYVSSSIEKALLHAVLNLLLRQLHLVWLACDIRRQYNALVDGSHSGGQEHSLPTAFGGQYGVNQQQKSYTRPSRRQTRQKLYPLSSARFLSVFGVCCHIVQTSHTSPPQLSGNSSSWQTVSDWRLVEVLSFLKVSRQSLEDKSETYCGSGQRHNSVSKGSSKSNCLGVSGYIWQHIPQLISNNNLKTLSFRRNLSAASGQDCCNTVVTMAWGG